MRTFFDRQALLGLSVVVLTLVALVDASVSKGKPYVLSSAENSLRSEMCGRVQQSKILDGTPISGKNAPWLVHINHISKGVNEFNTGFMISDRHVVTSSDALLDYNQDPANETFRWLADMSPADLKTCYNANRHTTARTMPVPNRVLRDVFVKSCADVKIGGNCQDAPAIPIAYADYIGNCDPSKVSYGIVVLELAFPVHNTVPLCVTKEPALVGEELLVYGAGIPKQSAKPSDATLATRNATVIECTGQQGHDEPSVCLHFAGSCRGDYGGPLTKLINGQRYAVGSLWSWDCTGRARNKHISLSFLSKDICQLTGVCPIGQQRHTYVSDMTSRYTTPMDARFAYLGTGSYTGRTTLQPYTGRTRRP